MTRINLKQALTAAVVFSAFTAGAQAASVDTILGRGAAVANVSVERVLVNGTHVEKVQGRSGQVAINKATAKFASGNSARATGEAVTKRLGRA